ncbi:MAG TPA: hypothetical protein VF740_04945 [Candidatus Acidoferrum sp.]
MSLLTFLRAGPCEMTDTERELLSLIARLCYNRAGVNFTANPEDASPAGARDSPEVPSPTSEVPGLVDKHLGSEDPSRYCPVCSHRLESRRCKLICSVCGYYMSCADYY